MPKEILPPPQLNCWTMLTDEVSVPEPFRSALSSGRTELLKLVKGPLSEDDAKRVANLVRVLLDTNRALQKHAADQAELLEQLRGNFKGVMAKLYQALDHANFRSPSQDGEEDE